jgi:hypothetical protein
LHLSPITGGRLTLPPAWPASAIPPLPAIDGSSPTIRVALPDGGQTQLPGVLWPNPSMWALTERTPRTASPPIEVRQLTRKQANVLTRA